MKNFLSFTVFGIVLGLALGLVILVQMSDDLKPPKHVYYPDPKEYKWNFQAIDTMKYSRDLAREKLEDKDFDRVIDAQVKAIADTGVTHVVVATPYDAEFLPMTKRWVKAARDHHLLVWFRGNFSGWEGWFEYPRISREEHLKKTTLFIEGNPGLFQDGDVFSGCPECENGGPGDPRLTQDTLGHRKFLLDEYKATEAAFRKINKSVRSNFFSMNGDVARLIMDKATTKALGGIVTVDHYVETPEQLVSDLEEIAEQSGGRVVLGEFGVPIPDIHGSMTEAEQAAWIDKALSLLRQSHVIEGMNYWLAVGGTTEIWEDHGAPKAAVAVLKKNYHPHVAYGFVYNELGRPLEGVEVRYAGKETDITNVDGRFTKAFVGDLPASFDFTLPGYLPEKKTLTVLNQEMEVVLTKEHKDWKFELLLWLRGYLGK